MTETTNFGLKKPEANDFYDFETQNDNLDVIDEKLKECMECGTAEKVTYENESVADVTNVKEALDGIFDGTKPVGDSERLGGKNASEYAIDTDLANYLPITGGTLTGRLTVHNKLMVTTDSGSNASVVLFGNVDETTRGVIGCLADGTPFYTKDWSANYPLLHTGNKPSGSYTGNGSADLRTINTGGIGQFLLLFNTSIGHAIVSIIGASVFLPDGTVRHVPSNEAKYDNGILTLATAGLLNLNSTGYFYNVP